MPRSRGAESERHGRRPRGEHTTESHSVLHAARRGGAHETTETTDSFQLFLNQASRYPLLTREQEVELAQRIEKGDVDAKDRRDTYARRLQALLRFKKYSNGCAIKQPSRRQIEPGARKYGRHGSTPP